MPNLLLTGCRNNDNTVFIMTDLILIVGAGPVGSALALDLTRRGVPVHIVDRADGPFHGSRAKGVQPRTLEVLEDLGVLDALLAGASAYPRLGIHLGPLTIPRTMIAHQPVTEDVPYPDTVLSPQFHTDRVLHDALRAAGVTVDYGRRVVGVEQHDDGVTTTFADGGTVHSAYVVGADGGSSTVRRQAGIGFTGDTDEDDRMIIADVTIPGLRRNRWHVWPGRSGRFLGACPLPDGELFQVMLRLPAATPVSNDPDALQATVREALAAKKLTVGEFSWVSLFRPNIRLAEHYRAGRVLLAGDAAHCHTPAGGQGLNTGVQDAYNLAWKLDEVLHGAPASLLDTYEEERRPVAARVLKISTDRYDSFEKDARAATTRGDEERQLKLTYRGSSLCPEGPDAATAGVLHAGDRLPDARDAHGRRVFDLTAGPGFSVLAVGVDAETLERHRQDGWPAVHEVPAGTYGAQSPTLLLVRPDGYIGYIGTADSPAGAPTGIDDALRRMRRPTP